MHTVLTRNSLTHTDPELSIASRNSKVESGPISINIPLWTPKTSEYSILEEFLCLHKSFGIDRLSKLSKLCFFLKMPKSYVVHGLQNQLLFPEGQEGAKLFFI